MAPCLGGARQPGLTTEVTGPSMPNIGLGHLEPRIRPGGQPAVNELSTTGGPRSPCPAG